MDGKIERSSQWWALEWKIRNVSWKLGEWWGSQPRGSQYVWQPEANSHRLQKSHREKGMAWPLSNWERVWGPERDPTKAGTLPGQAIRAFLGTWHCWWSLFTTHGFTAGDYLLQTTNERMLLITSKRRTLQLQGESGWTGYTQYLGGLAPTLGS